MRLAMLLGITAVAWLGLAGCGGSDEEDRKPFKAGVASVKITPETEGLYLGGWGENRVFTKVHDDIYARALVFERGSTKVAWVAVDLVGLMAPDVDKIRAQVKDIPPENIVIACSHVHSAPDTIGLWGPDETTPGADPDYMEFVRARIAEAIKQAQRGTRVARIKLAKAQAPPNCAVNHNDPEMIDTEISLLQVVNPADEPVATVVNWACHPECLDSKNLELTSDYVHWLRQVVEAETGAPCLFFNGALGGMVSPDLEDHCFAEAERIGTAVGKTAAEALKEAEGPLRPDLAFRTQRVTIPLKTDRLAQALAAGLIVSYRGHKGHEVEVDLSVMWLGPSVWVTMPGEPLPAVGEQAKALAEADYKFLVTLANSELGYILPRAFWGRDKYEYEMSMSLGPDTADLCLAALKDLLAGPPAWVTGKSEEEAATATEATATEGEGTKEAAQGETEAAPAGGGEASSATPRASDPGAASAGQRGSTPAATPADAGTK